MEGESDLFEAPRIEAELSKLLQSISEHGGYAYASIVTLAAAGDPRAAETACDMAWEQLHSGPWHSVLPIWRDAYSIACLYVAMYRSSGGDYKEALRVLDMGIIMGGTLLRKDLESAIEKVSVKANAARVLNSIGKDGELIPTSQSSSLCGHLDKLEVHQTLPMKALSNKIVAKISALSLEGFLRDYFLPGFPVIITDCMAHWPATEKWHHTDYLKRVAGDRTVPVEVGKNYLCPEWKQELITFSQFLDRIQDNSSSDGITYLAQHPLFDQISELRNDICIPDYCFVGGGELRSLNAWFGPAGTVTPLHHDPHHNILAQKLTGDNESKKPSKTSALLGRYNDRDFTLIVGQKYVRLYAATLREELHPYSETMLCNSSQVDLDKINEEEFPNVKDLEFLDCILEEGEMLYIPPKWWHYVKSLSTSFSVSFWWNNSSELSY